MYASCLSRLSAGRSLSSSKLKLTSSLAITRRLRVFPEMSGHPSPVDGQQSQHLTWPAFSSGSLFSIHDDRWRHKSNLSHDYNNDSNNTQLTHSFPLLATNSLLGIATALSFSLGNGPVAFSTPSHSPRDEMPFIVQSSLRPESLKMTGRPPATTAATAAAANPLLNSSGQAPSPAAASAPAAAILRNPRSPGAPEAASSNITMAPPPEAAAAAPRAAESSGSRRLAAEDFLLPVSKKPEAADAPGITVSAALPSAFLPVALRTHVPASVADYWAGVRQAVSEGRLHATVFVSAQAWPQHEPTVASMVGPDGSGPGEQVRFALVPLAPEFEIRAARALNAMQLFTTSATSRTTGITGNSCGLPTSSGSLTSSNGWGDDGAANGNGATGCEEYPPDNDLANFEALARRFGLDVTLAAAVYGASTSPVRRSDLVAGVVPASAAAQPFLPSGRRLLETCPAMAVCGGYMAAGAASGGSGFSGSGSGEMSPPWRMRQDLDEHVRRNLVLIRGSVCWQRLQLESPFQNQDRQWEQRQQSGTAPIAPALTGAALAVEAPDRVGGGVRSLRERSYSGTQEKPPGEAVVGFVHGLGKLDGEEAAAEGGGVAAAALAAWQQATAGRVGAPA